MSHQTPGGRVMYEVTLEVDAAIATAFADWLGEHVDAMLALPGFLSASWWTAGDEGPRRQWIVQYRLESPEALERYLAEHAAAMRWDGVSRFGDRFRASRRVLELVAERP